MPGFGCTVNYNKSTSSSKRDLCLPCNITRTKSRITILADEGHTDEEKKPP